MATKFITGNDKEFYKELQKLIKIPDHCQRLIIEVAYNEVATVTFITVAEKGTGEPFTKSYAITELKEG